MESPRLLELFDLFATDDVAREVVHRKDRC